MGICSGIVLGLSVFTFSYAEGASYFSNDAAACINCHVMEAQYDGWQRGSHANVAVCNDCHSPKGFISKYVVKGINGYNHSLAFTTGNFEDHMEITELNRKVAEQNCRRCHEPMVHSIRSDYESMSCLQCHADVGH